MPHSSGGGSHSGGSHHSSSHGGRGGGSSVRYSRRPFRNARRFMYYNRSGEPCYIYSNTTPKPMNIAIFIFQMIFLIPFVLAGLFTSFTGFLVFRPAKPLKPVYTEPQTRIMDFADVIDNSSELEAVLKDFEDLTGISPCVATVYDSMWKNNYTSLENYAFDMYVNTFEDEQHFLVVYSEPENAAELDFVDWSWEGMQGNDTDFIITQANFSRFQTDLQTYLTKDSYSVGQAFTQAFKNSEDYIMSSNSNLSAAAPVIIFAVIWNLIVFVMIFSIIKSFICSRRNYVEVKNDDMSINGDVVTFGKSSGSVTSSGTVNPPDYRSYQQRTKTNVPDDYNTMDYEQNLSSESYNDSYYDDNYSSDSVIDESSVEMIDDTEFLK